MKAVSLRDKSKQELRLLDQEKRLELAKLRLELQLGKSKNTNLIRQGKRELAKILTVLAEKEVEHA